MHRIEFAGDVHHPVAQAVRAQWLHTETESPLFVNFCFTRNTDTVSSHIRVAQRLRTRLRICARDSVRYVLVVEENADPYIADMVLRGLAEFRVNGCVLDLGIVFGDGVMSVVDDFVDAVQRRVPIPVSSSSKTFRFVHASVAVEAVLQYAPAQAETGRLRVQEMDGTSMCQSEVASLIARRWMRPSTHLTFTDDDANDGSSTVFVF